MAKTPVPKEVQARAARYIQETFKAYEDRMMPRKGELLEVYEAYSTFKEPREENWASSFKVNKAKEIIEKVTPSLVAKNPRWVVSIRNVKSFKDTDEMQAMKDEIMQTQGGRVVDVDNLVLAQKEESVQEQAEAVQDYLTYIFDQYSLMDKVAIFGKCGIEDGKGYAEVIYKIEKAYIPKRTAVLDELGNQVIDEVGNLQYAESNEEVVTGEYPTLDIIDWSDAFYDTRILDLKDRPAFVRLRSNVRLSALMRFKGRYMNLDILKEICTAAKASYEGDRDQFKARIYQIAGIQDYDHQSPVDENSLTIKYFYGYFSHTGEPEDEKFYKIATVDDLVVIEMKELTQNPIEEWKCFPNTKNANAVGFVEPILGLQEELNFKKNAAAEYINKAIFRQRVWSENSGIDPKTLNDQVIATTVGGQEAIANIPEVPFATLGPDFFNEQNDFERQIQSATHTVDTSNPNTQNSLTGTATGAKIKFFESNKVLDYVRQRFEAALERIAYKFLQSAFENMSDNIVFKKTKTAGYWYANKELLRDAINKYQIKVEVNSSSLTDAEDRRNESLSWLNILTTIDAMLEKSGSDRRVDFIPVLEDIGGTYEKKDPMKYLRTMNMMPQMGMPAPGGGGSAPKAKMTAPAMSEAEQTTKSIVGQI